jgi:hypothetical protein
VDRSETLALGYLQSLGADHIIYEPDGNIPPDFLVDSRLAIEVRRLNQNYGDSVDYQGVETAEAATLQMVLKLLPAFGAAPDGVGYWVFVYFWRPLDWKAVKRALRLALDTFKANPQAGGLRQRLTASFEVDIRPAGIKVADYFRLGGSTDRDQGGFTVAEIIRNLNLAIAEKATKIAPYRERYSEWWLVLPNYIDTDLDADERASIAKHVDIKEFDQVVLIDPRDPTRALVLR